jgi:hypothetical protein
VHCPLRLSLIPSAVEELLRYDCPSQHTARLASKDTVLGDKEVRKNQAVIAVMAAGNRDPERFPAQTSWTSHEKTIVIWRLGGSFLFRRLSREDRRAIGFRGYLAPHARVNSRAGSIGMANESWFAWPDRTSRKVLDIIPFHPLPRSPLNACGDNDQQGRGSQSDETVAIDGFGRPAFSRLQNFSSPLKLTNI